MVDTLEAPMKTALDAAKKALPASSGIGTSSIAQSDVPLPLSTTNNASSAVRGNKGGAFRRGTK
jgi:hypothetical protein